jgi:hypothetical protein
MAPTSPRSGQDNATGNDDYYRGTDEPDSHPHATAIEGELKDDR